MVTATAPCSPMTWDCFSCKGITSLTSAKCLVHSEVTPSLNEGIDVVHTTMAGSFKAHETRLISLGTEYSHVCGEI